MKLKVINEKNIAVMSTEDVLCFPTQEQLVSMTRAGYKFTIDGKKVNQKKINEIKKEYKNKKRE